MQMQQRPVYYLLSSEFPKVPFVIVSQFHENVKINFNIILNYFNIKKYKNATSFLLPVRPNFHTYQILFMYFQCSSQPFQEFPNITWSSLMITYIRTYIHTCDSKDFSNSIESIWHRVVIKTARSVDIDGQAGTLRTPVP